MSLLFSLVIKLSQVVALLMLSGDDSIANKRKDSEFLINLDAPATQFKIFDMGNTMKKILQTPKLILKVVFLILKIKT